MNNNINDKIYEKVRAKFNFQKKDQSGYSTVPTLNENLKSFEINNKMVKIYDIRKFILSKTYYIRILLVLGFKQITWRKELEVKFDIYPRYITEFFEYMKENGMILFKPLTEVENILFEAVIKQNSVAFYGKRDVTKVYTLSEEGKEIITKLMDEIAKLTNERTDLQLDLEMINNKTKEHRSIMSNIIKEEETLLERRITYPDGFIETRKTIKAKKFEMELKIASKELKQESLLNKQKQQGLITQQEVDSLMIVNKSNNLATITQDKEELKKKSIPYNGIYSHLTTNELEDLLKGDSKEEIKLIETKHKKQMKEHVKELTKNTTEELGGTIVLRGYHNDGLEETNKINNDKGMDFLNSL